MVIGNSSLVGTLAFALVMLAACGNSSNAGDATSFGDLGGSGSGLGGAQAVAGATSSSGSGAGGATMASASEFPCDVQAFLAAKCQVCHKADPPGALLLSSDFRRPSKIDPQKTVGEVALERLVLTTTLRMPPAPLAAATDAEIASLSKWIAAGAMPATCGDAPPAVTDPYATPVVCTSMTNWTGGNRESPLMRPGGACISCHTKEGEGPLFAVAGTLFPTPHEPDDCNGVDSVLGAKVVVTDANGTEHELPVNRAGNFFLESNMFALPYQAKVVYAGRERVMVEAQKNGDCNDCHTQDGRESAPGRIFLP